MSQSTSCLSLEPVHVCCLDPTEGMHTCEGCSGGWHNRCSSRRPLKRAWSPGLPGLPHPPVLSWRGSCRSVLGLQPNYCAHD